MPITPTYPGVYIQEVPSGVRTITGVATSIGAFLGNFSRGRMNEAERLFSYGDFEREFGGLVADSEASYAIRQFFLNGGGQAWVVRVAGPVAAATALLTLKDDSGGIALELEAEQAGSAANRLRVEVDYDASDPSTEFNLRLYESGETTPLESYSDLTPASAEAGIDGPSALLAVITVGGARPSQTGTTGGDISGLAPGTLTDDSVNVFLNGTQIGSFQWGAGSLGTLTDVRDRLQNRLQGLPGLGSATVDLFDDRLRILPNTGNDQDEVTLVDDGGTLVADLLLDAGNAVVVPQRLAFAGGVDATESSSAAIDLQDAAGGTPVLRVSAANEGAWGNTLRVDVDHAVLDPAGDPDTLFNLRFLEMGEVSGREAVVRDEAYTGVVIDESSNRHVTEVVDGSSLAAVALVGTPGAGTRPAQTGTISAPIGTGGGEINLNALSGGTMQVSLNGGTEHTVTLGTGPFTVASLASALQAAIRVADDSVDAATVEVLGSGATRRFLRVKAGTDDPADIITFSDNGSSDTLAAHLGLDVAARTNVQQYVLGASTAAGAQALPEGSPRRGLDGGLPDSAALLGSRAAKTGMYALLDVDLFNLLCIPDTMRLSDDEAGLVIAEATSLCEEERAFYIVDVPQPSNPRDQPDEIQEWLDGHGALRHRNVAVYYPRPLVADPLNEFRARAIAISGTMAGLYARTDAARGVWKAPAGTEAALRGIQSLEYRLTDAENGVLNPLGINALRNRPVVGNVAWGARTLVGADSMASEWKYVPVRRLALYIEETLFRGTQWVVFEPNDETLWSQIRLNVGTFMNTLFRQGAFQGTNPRQAYFVKCDSEVNPQADIDRGIVNIVVGFAPLKPAEFVIISLQQMAGQSDA